MQSSAVGLFYINMLNESLKKILIVDDVPAISNRIAQLLEEKVDVHYILYQANTLEDALKMLASETFHLVLLDIHLKDKNGILLLQEIKRKTPDMQVVMITNNDTDAYRNACLQLGASDFLDKSKDFEFLPKVVADILDR